ncbi:hypothetical protein PIB30_030258 [Stylosanthes scabra]|uniref:Uncharacterized protein n=1 Tax=Stylosanthes scabra TaxID=79078 RepID=A0ABU6XDE6_9FABA|nr:hypothetical protein [Stylosanthes scabra]
MTKDGGRGRGLAGRGRGRPKKNTGVRLNLDSGSRPLTSTPTTTTTTTATTTPPFVATGGLSAGLPQMVMIPTPGSRVQSSDTAGAPHAQQSPCTSSQPQSTTPATDTDVAEDDTEAAASATADPWPLLIWDGHDCWDDVRAGTKEITNIFMEHYKWYAPYSARHLMRLSNSGGRSGGFAQGDEANIRKAWEIRAAKCHRGMMHNICEKGAPHHWILDDIFRRYLDYWASANYQAMRRANKSNHTSSTGGSLHTGGRSLTLPLQRRWRQRLGAYPRRVRYFCGPTPGKRIAEQHKAEIKRLEDECAARIAVGEPPGPPINEDEVWDRIAGERKRGRVYGKDKVPKRPAPRLVDPEDASTCIGPDTREHITLLNREIQQQAEAYKQEMEAWKRRYETDVTRLQTTLDTQSVEFDQWKSIVSQMYSFMQQMQGSSSSSMPPPPSLPPSSAPRPPRPQRVDTAGAPTATDHDLDDDGSSMDDEDYD